MSSKNRILYENHFHCLTPTLLILLNFAPHSRRYILPLHNVITGGPRVVRGHSRYFEEHLHKITNTDMRVHVHPLPENRYPVR